MDRRLQLIAHLYEEELDGLEPLDALLEDPELRKEYRVLQEARFALEHRERALPDARAIDAILAASRPASGDRPPLRLVRLRRVMLPALAAAAAILLFVSLPLDQATDTATAPPEAERREAGGVSAESLLRTLPPAAPEPALPALAKAEAEADADVEDDVPSWDSGRDVRSISRRIAALRAAGVDRWDEEAVPLEMLPTSTGRTDLVPTGVRRPDN